MEAVLTEKYKACKAHGWLASHPIYPPGSVPDSSPLKESMHAHTIDIFSEYYLHNLLIIANIGYYFKLKLHCLFKSHS